MMLTHATLLVLSCLAVTTVSTKHRRVTFWYVPDAYGGGDIDSIVNLMAQHNNTVSSVILECGHSINSTNPLGVNCAEPYDQLSKKCKIGADTCLKTIKGLAAANINSELLVGGPDGSGEGPATNFMPSSFKPANATIFANTMVEVAKRFGAVGVNIDAEPDQGSGPTILPPSFVTFLSTIKPILNAAGVRVTADVAQWCKMTSDYALLAPHVDRMLNMEQYNANSMEGWLNGDDYGGFYTSFVNRTKFPISKAGPSLGIWNALCGKLPCWSTTKESGAPRIDRMIADGVEEIALFRLMWIKGSHYPAEWWWPLLDLFASSPLHASSELLPTVPTVPTVSSSTSGEES